MYAAHYIIFTFCSFQADIHNSHGIILRQLRCAPREHLKISRTEIFIVAPHISSWIWTPFQHIAQRQCIFRHTIDFEYDIRSRSLPLSLSFSIIYRWLVSFAVLPLRHSEPLSAACVVLIFFFVLKYSWLGTGSDNDCHNMIISSYDSPVCLYLPSTRLAIWFLRQTKNGANIRIEMVSAARQRRIIHFI